MSAVIRVLLAEDEAHLGLILETFLRGRGHEVTRVSDGRAALDTARGAAFDVALLDVVMPEMDGLEVLGALMEMPLAPEAVVMTGNGTVDTAIHALALGAYDYVTKPYRMAEVDQLVRRAAEKRALRLAAARNAWQERDRVPVTPASDHPPLRDALARAAAAAKEGRPPLVVEGEAGTGRRTAARWLASLVDPGMAVLTFDCTGGAAADARALLGSADGGEGEGERAGVLGVSAGHVLVLSDAHRLDHDLGGRLVAAMEAGSYERADGSGRGGVPARLMATAAPGWSASDAPLARHLGSHGTLTLPALVERVVDIGTLASRFLAGGGTVRRVGADAVAALAARRWPGNLAELQGVMGIVAHHAAGPTLTASDLRAAGFTDTSLGA